MAREIFFMEFSHLSFLTIFHFFGNAKNVGSPKYLNVLQKNTKKCLSLTIYLPYLQASCRRYLNVPPLQIEEMSFKNLMVEASETDSIYDIVFHVEGETFPAHKYIVFSRAKGLQNVVLPYGDKHIYLNYKGLSSKMFELMMKHIYCNHTLSLTGDTDS